MQQKGRLLSLKCVVLAVSTVCAIGGVSAQASDPSNYPSSAVRVVIPFAAGGPADIAGRAFSQHLGEQLGGSVIVENRGGGGGVVAINAVSGANPDGHTLLFAASGNVTVQPLLANPIIEIDQRLRPIAQVTASPHGLFVTSKLPVNTLEEFIAYAKANPGKLNFATPGVGGLGHLGVEYFKNAAGIDAQTIHYKGASQAVKDMISGEVHAMLSSPASLQGMVDQGSLKLLGLTGPTQSEAMKSVPLISKVVPGFEYTTWYGFYAPKDTPDAVVNKISQALANPNNQQKLVDSLRAQGIDVVITNPEQLKRLAAEDTVKWQKVISAAGINLK
jgi:tripartite-type tricarboxylate transporter receptor subunit TctC